MGVMSAALAVVVSATAEARVDAAMRNLFIRNPCLLFQFSAVFIVQTNSAFYKGNNIFSIQLPDQLQFCAAVSPCCCIFASVARNCN
jgi:hypothetical protein